MELKFIKKFQLQKIKNESKNPSFLTLNIAYTKPPFEAYVYKAYFEATYNTL